MTTGKTVGSTHRITPFLWFKADVEEAMKFYSSIFKNSRVLDISRGPDGKVMSATFELEGQRFIGLSGGPGSFTEAVSFLVDCQTQDDVDELWDKLSKGGEKSRCGWLKDVFGLSWQVIPTVLGRMLSDPDPQRAQRVLDAMFKMDKIEIETLKKAYAEPSKNRREKRS